MILNIIVTTDDANGISLSVNVSVFWIQLSLQLMMETSIEINV